MNFLNLVSLFFTASCTSLPAPQSPLQKISTIAKNAYGDARNYLDLAHEKFNKAKDFFMEKVRNIGKRGEPLYKEEDGEQMPELSEAEIQKILKELLSSMNIGDMDKTEDEKTIKTEDEKAEKTEDEKKQDERAL